MHHHHHTLIHHKPENSGFGFSEASRTASLSFIFSHPLHPLHPSVHNPELWCLSHYFQRGQQHTRRNFNTSIHTRQQKETLYTCDRCCLSVCLSASLSLPICFIPMERETTGREIEKRIRVCDEKSGRGGGIGEAGLRPSRRFLAGENSFCIFHAVEDGVHSSVSCFLTSIQNLFLYFDSSHDTSIVLHISLSFHLYL